VFPQDEVVRVCALARSRGLATFLDGARLWNASVASGLSEAELAAPFDLGGSVVLQRTGCAGRIAARGLARVDRRRKPHRRMLGGAMRQVGIFAAAALYGLEHHRERLAEDHEHARLLAEALAGGPAVMLDLDSVQTNIVVFRLAPGSMDADYFGCASRERGVLLNAFGPRTVRAVTHLDVSREQVERAARFCATF